MSFLDKEETMNIISKIPNQSGAYPPVQSWNGETPPDTHYEVADSVQLSCGGFGMLTVVDDVVTAFTPDEVVWTAWQTANQPETPINDTSKADALATIQKATTIAGLKAAMLNYIDVAGIG